jgi:hypothetical protein
MKQRTLLIAAAIVILLPILTKAQKIKSLQASAKGRGTINVSNLSQQKINSILVILKEDGTAQITLYTDMQLLVQGTWSIGDPEDAIVELKITGGIVTNGGKGEGKLVLRDDEKSIKSLAISGKSADNMTTSVEFVADEPPPKNP